MIRCKAHYGIGYLTNPRKGDVLCVFRETKTHYGVWRDGRVVYFWKGHWEKI